MGSNLGELLLREKLLNTEQLQTAIDYQKKNEVAMGTAIVSLGLITEEDMAQALGVSYRVLNYAFKDALGVSPEDMVVLTTSGTPRERGEALRDAIQRLGPGTEERPKVVILGPGTFDLGAEPIDLPDRLSLVGMAWFTI